MNADDSPKSAILAETRSRLQTQSAAVTLRIWHHLASDEARLLLFEPFRAQDRPYPLLEAILLAAENPGARFTLKLEPLQIREGTAPLTEALGSALGELFGLERSSATIRAWQGVLHRLLDRIAERGERRSA